MKNSRPVGIAWIAVAVVVTLALGMVGCGERQPAATEGAAAVEEITPVPEPVVAPEEIEEALEMAAPEEMEEVAEEAVEMTAPEEMEEAAEEAVEMAEPEEMEEAVEEAVEAVEEPAAMDEPPAPEMPPMEHPAEPDPAAAKPKDHPAH
jgi:hypothetical protein